MGGYAALVDLTDRFGEPELIELTDRDGFGTVDETVLGAALAEADAEIDGYLAARYPLPLAEVPPLLVRLACDIARYRLARDQPLEEVRRRYEDARRLLEQMASGRVTLGLPAADAPRADAGRIATRTRPPQFEALP